MSRRREVVVVGAGVMGSSTAWWLARAGVDVLLLERFAAGHDRGSSHGAARVFRLAYADPLYAGLARHALGPWRELEDEADERLLTPTGGIDHGDAEPLDRIAGALSQIGAPFEYLSEQQVSERWAGLRIDGTAFFQPDAGVIAADATVAALQRCAAIRGAETRFEEPAREIRPRSEEVIVTTERDEVRAGVVVVTAGAWLAKLVDGVVRLPRLTITQEQPAYFAPRAADLPWPVFIHRTRPGISGGATLGGLPVYGLPTPGHGVKVGEHGTGPVVDPDQRTDPDPAGIERLARYVERWLPGLDPSPRSVISCLYTTTPDEHFVLGRTGRIVVGSPCSGHGFKFAPALGRTLSELALGRGEPPAVWATVGRGARSSF